MDSQTEYLIKVIYEGADFEDSSHLTKLYQAFQKNHQNAQNSWGEDCDSGYPTIGLEQLGRIKDMKKFFEWIPVPPIHHNRFQKSSEVSSLLRERANKCLYSADCTDDENNERKALRGYNLAVAFAPSNSAEMALALERRADLLLRQNRPDLAQLDIHSVANNKNYPHKSLKSSQKLIDLQNKCSKLAHENQTKNNLLKNRKPNVLATFAGNNFYRLPSKNKGVENVSEFCEIDFHPHCGRRIIVTRPVEPGEVLMVDEPYSIVLEKVLYWDLEHCSNCSKPVTSGLPCDCCTFAWFCSSTCKDEASRFTHKYERYLSYLKSTKLMSLKGLLAARLLFKVGPEELYRIFSCKDPLYFQHSSDSLYKGYSDKGIYTAKSYLPIFHLISHPDVDLLKSKSNTFKALILTHLIEDTSQFFQKFRFNEDYEDFKEFISSLLLRHMESIEYNAITLSQLVSSPSPSKLLESSTTLRYGAAVYPLLCLVNHSCDPNSVPVRSLKFLKTSVIAMKPMKPGDEVTFSYAPHFSNMEMVDRRKFLFDRYNFTCQCEACLNQWGPESSGFLKHVPESQCNSCGKYLLVGQCPKCITKDLDIVQNLPIFQSHVLNVQKLIDDKEFKQALEMVKPCLVFCYENLPHNFKLCLEYQELFKIILVKLVSL